MSAQNDEGFELVPPGVEPLEADAALALEDDLAGGDPLVLAPTAPPPLGRAPAYDFVERRFIPGQAGGPLEVTGLSTLALWIEKALRTRQGENPAVDPGFGVSILPEDLLDGGVLDDSALAEAYDDWERAILVHPRVSAVEAMRVEIDPGVVDYIFLTLRVTPEGLGDDVLAIDALPLPIGGPEA
jgi:hypothetical protein